MTVSFVSCKMKADTYIKYIDDDDEKKDGFFELLEKTAGYITFLTSTNKVTIPMHRVIKVKERGDVE